MISDPCVPFATLVKFIVFFSVCYFAATSARPGLVPDSPLSAVSGLTGNGNPLGQVTSQLSGAVPASTIGGLAGTLAGAASGLPVGALPTGALGK